MLFYKLMIFSCKEVVADNDWFDWRMAVSTSLHLYNLQKQFPSASVRLSNCRGSWRSKSSEKYFKVRMGRYYLTFDFKLAFSKFSYILNMNLSEYRYIFLKKILKNEKFSVLFPHIFGPHSVSPGPLVTQKTFQSFNQSRSQLPPLSWCGPSQGDTEGHWHWKVAWGLRKTGAELQRCYQTFIEVLLKIWWVSAKRSLEFPSWSNDNTYNHSIDYQLPTTLPSERKESPAWRNIQLSRFIGPSPSYPC